MALTRGRLQPRPLEIESIEPIKREDLHLLKDLRENVHPAAKGLIQRLRDPHHMLARFIAMGLKTSEAARRAGYTQNRVTMLKESPAFQELIAHYRKQVQDGWKEEVDEYMELATSNMLKAERQLAEKLEQAEEDDTFLPTRDLIAISRDAADRFGYGKKTVNLNVNVDMAARLENAIKRSSAAKVINATPIQAMPQGMSPSLAPPIRPAPDMTNASAGASPEAIREVRRI